MKYFQIRVPAECCLEQVLQDISKEIWLTMKDELVSEDHSTDIYEQLQESVKSAVMEEIERFENCGLAEECHDDIEGGPWVNYSDKIYMLALTGDFDLYIQQTTRKVVNGMKGLFHDQQPVLQHKISTALSRRLGKYLYFNPSCKRIPFCQLHLS